MRIKDEYLPQLFCKHHTAVCISDPLINDDANAFSAAKRLHMKWCSLATAEHEVTDSRYGVEKKVEIESRNFHISSVKEATWKICFI